MRTAVLLLGVLGWVLLPGGRSSRPGPAGSTVYANEPRVLAHYMPWFKAEPVANGSMVWDHWQWFGRGPKHDPDDFRKDGRRDIASVFYPLIGPYDGRDPKVLEYHLLTARACGIEGFVADWYGPDSYTDEVFGDLVKAAERCRMKVAICLEEKSFFPGYGTDATRADVLDKMEGQIRHVLATHAQSPAYLRHDGEPVFFMFNGFGDSAVGFMSLTPGELGDVLGRFADNPVFLVRGHFDSNYLGVVRGNYAWCGDASYRDWFYQNTGPARADGRLDYVVGVASPGFDDSGVNGWGKSPRVTDRRGTQEYRDNWDRLLPAHPDAVQIVTWNDFQEGTTVEPAEEYGFTFLDLTERYVEAFTGRPLWLGDNRWGYRVYGVRDRIERAQDRKAAHELAGQVDRFVQAMLDGRRWFIGWRLAWLEWKASRLAPTGQAQETGDET